MIALRPIAAWVAALLLLLSSAVPLAAQETDAPSANDLHEFTRLLADDRIQNWLQAQAEAEDTETAVPEPALSLRDQLDDAMAHVSMRVGDLSAALASAGRAPAVITRKWHDQLSPGRQVRSLTFMLIFLFFGAGLEWLSRQYTNPLRRRVEGRHVHTPKERLFAGLTRMALTFIGLTMFAIGSIGAFSLVTWPPVLETLILAILIGVISIRAVNALIKLFLAPTVPHLRLVPVGNTMARVVGRALMVFSALFILASALIDVFADLTAADARDGISPEALSVSVVFHALLLVVALALIVLCFARARRHSDLLSRRSLANWRTYLGVLSVLIFVTWLLDMRPILGTVLSIGLAIPALRLLRGWTDMAFDRMGAEGRTGTEATPHPLAIEAETATEEPDAPEPTPDPYDTYRPIVQRLIRFGVFIALGLTLAVIWNAGIFETSDNPTVGQRLFSILIDSAAALLIADLVWTWGKTAIDRRLADYKPPEDGQAPGPEARMATLLPLLRVVLMVTLASMVLMSVLSSMGVNIAPILAGASVLGIAIGFGAQSLVKDVVSGIFFLIDDAFRVGEYVEIGDLRGTVERISIRSLQIRHHRGAVHTLPFGELTSMTNYSRDWVIMKLEFRVPFDTDLNLVKKLIKKVGAELKANEAYGDAIIQTLKSQGVRRMEEFNMVVGVKFMTRPGEQWTVRRDAYQKVRDIFEANGIRMAERNVKVEIAGDENLSDTERKAVTAAAQDAIAPPVVPGTA